MQRTSSLEEGGVTEHEEIEELDELDMLTGLMTRPDIDQQIGKIAVWYVHRSRIEQGLRLAAAQGVELTEDQLYELAFKFRAFWQLDASRTERKRCFICRTKLPPQEEVLCKCFQAAEVARFIECTPQGIDDLRRRYPDGWTEVLAETIQCLNPDCSKIAEVKAGVVAAFLRKGKPWKSPKWCMDCYQTKHSKSVPPPPALFKGKKALKVSLEDSSKVSLQELQEKIVKDSAPVAES
jgi:hypothetical protein